jgi:hypothetical protein
MHYVDNPLGWYEKKIDQVSWTPWPIWSCPLDMPQGLNDMLVKVSLQGWNPMTTTFCFNQLLCCVCIIKWLKNLMLPSCEFVKSCSSYFAQRFMTRQHTKTWKLVLSIHYIMFIILLKIAWDQLTKTKNRNKNPNH